MTLLLVAGTVHAADEELSLADLMDLKVEVASQTAKPLRETPGIVTVFTRQELLSMGLVSLREVLEQVPGFAFSTGSEATVALAVRGQEVTDGKILVLRDGNSMVESAWGTFEFDDHLDLSQVERIEIIRGPGSAMYGGEAEMAVINIVSRAPSSYSGLEAGATVRSSRGDLTGYGGAFGWGTVVPAQDFEGAISGSWVNSRRSTDSYGSPGSAPLSMQDNFGITSGQLNLYAAWMGWEVRAMLDRYHSGVVYQYPQLDSTTQAPVVDSSTGAMAFGKPITGEIVWDGCYANVQKRFSLSNGLSLRTRVRARLQQPWSYSGAIADQDGYAPYDVTSARGSGDLVVDWTPSDILELVAGSEILEDRIWKNRPGEAFANGSDEVHEIDLSQYGELTLRTDWANLLSGYRWDGNDRFGNSFVPRFAVTKAWKTVNLKLLYSKAFKTPNVYVAENPGISPELTTVMESEVGVLLSDHWSAVANVFESEIDRLIIFVPDSLGGGGKYANQGSSDVAGWELEVRRQGRSVQAAANYSYYRNIGSAPQDMAMASSDRSRLGLPQHRINARLTMHATPWLDLHTSGTWASSCQIFYAPTPFAAPVEGREAPRLVLNAGLGATLPFGPDLRIRLDVRNLTDDDKRLGVLARSGGTLFPQMGREYRLGLNAAI
jgi:outer membrane cobalamin receptor